MSRNITSKNGRKYLATEIPELDMVAIFDTMEQEATDDFYEDKMIDYNYVNYICGCLDNLSDEDILYYINEYEKHFRVTGVDFKTDKRYEVVKEL